MASAEKWHRSEQGERLGGHIATVRCMEGILAELRG